MAFFGRYHAIYHQFIGQKMCVSGFGVLLAVFVGYQGVVGYRNHGAAHQLLVAPLGTYLFYGFVSQVLAFFYQAAYHARGYEQQQNEYAYYQYF